MRKVKAGLRQRGAGVMRWGRMRVLTLSIAALMLATPAVEAQNIFKPLQDFARELSGTQKQAPRQTAPRPVPAAQPTPASERPNADAKPEAEAPAAEVDVPAADEPPLPRPRPEEAEKPAEPAAPKVDAPAEPETPAEEAPKAEEAKTTPSTPDRVYQTACPALLSGKVIVEMLPPIAEGICGERSPLSITGVRVNGHEVPFSSPVTTNCQMAGALADWVGEVDAYAKVAMESPVAELTTGTSMMCRNRNGGDERFMSEHGFANALDVVGFTLEDGKAINVKASWNPATTAEGKLLRQAHGAACARFTTVLGPEANAEHADHLHVDLGCHGKTCTAQICE